MNHPKRSPLLLFHGANLKGNTSGRDWVKKFLSRHKHLTTRLTQNIKRNRAETNPDVITKYFEALKDSLAGVPAQNIANYNETNF
jgi:hypothetical protein